MAKNSTLTAEVAEELVQEVGIAIHANGDYKYSLKEFPFSSKLCFAKLLDHWEKRLHSDCEADRILAEHLFAKLEEAPELRAPIDDPSILEKYKETVGILLAGLIPSSRRESVLAVVSNPFNPNGFYKTPAFEEMYQKKQAGLMLSKEPEMIKSFMVIRPSVEILNTFYGQQIELNLPTIFTVQNADNDLERHYKSQLDLTYVEVKAVKPLKKLSSKQIHELLSNVNDLDLWQKYIPPENFEFRGVVVMELIDITDEEAISRVKNILLQKDAVVNRSSLLKIQHHMRTLFRLPDLRIGITAVDCSRRDSTLYPNHLANSVLSDSGLSLLSKEFKGSIYCRACGFKEPVLIEDIKAESWKTRIEEALLERNIRNILVAPLKNGEGEIIGMLELASPHPQEINSISALRLDELAPLFTVAVERKREEISNQVEAVIREQYTAVHPTVSWRFRETASKLLEDREKMGMNAPIEDIVFEDIYPLYGQMDIVGSSNIRNKGIQQDLIQNLELALDVASLGLEMLHYPLLDQLILKIHEHLTQIRSGIDSSDEAKIIEFLSTEVHPIFEQIKIRDKETAERVEAYYKELDPELHIIYRERKAYEQSVSMINDMIGSFLDQQQVAVQHMFPHYFEKYKTDGVEYNMYIGQSLVKRENFDYIHLKNLRLWQLLSMCEVTRKVEVLQKDMPVPLTTAQMILVHNSPLTIRFFMDEKQFDVDGAYNVRYEILKKRVDKSTIEGTGERLTVAGKIAIIYTQDKEEREYLNYLEYLVQKGQISPDIEKVQLAPVQGVSGLRALRVTVEK